MSQNVLTELLVYPRRPEGIANSPVWLVCLCPGSRLESESYKERC